IWQSIKEADFLLIFAAFALFYFGYLIIALRQRGLLGAQGIRVKITFLLQSFAIGMFFSNLLPSTIGGDASRMYDVWRVAGSKSKAVSVVLMDRFLGMFALVTFGFAAAIMSPQIQAAVPGIVLYMGLILAAMITVLWVVFGSGAAMVDWFFSLRLGPLSFLQRLAEKLYNGFSLFKGRKDVLVKAVLWSLLLQLNVIIHFVIMTYALSIDVPVTAMFIIVPLANILMLIPISINGIGLREAIFVFLFGIYGVATESSVAYAWIALGMILAQGIVGGIVFLLRRKVGEAAVVS
nr:flippase-like domain-containing protein [Acidiferrobacterales bacterium]